MLRGGGCRTFTTIWHVSLELQPVHLNQFSAMLKVYTTRLNNVFDRLYKHTNYKAHLLVVEAQHMDVCLSGCFYMYISLYPHQINRIGKIAPFL